MAEDYKVIDVEPYYDYNNPVGGHFKIYFQDMPESPFTLGFIPFISHYMKENENLTNYLEKTKDRNSTLSHAVYDLYDIGFPLDEWVKAYVEDAKNRTNAELFNLMLQFYQYIKNYNSGSSDTLT